MDISILVLPTYVLIPWNPSAAVRFSVLPFLYLIKAFHQAFSKKMGVNCLLDKILLWIFYSWESDYSVKSVKTDGIYHLSVCYKMLACGSLSVAWKIKGFMIVIGTMGDSTISWDTYRFISRDLCRGEGSSNLQLPTFCSTSLSEPFLQSTAHCKSFFVSQNHWRSLNET